MSLDILVKLTVRYIVTILVSVTLGLLGGLGLLMLQEPIYEGSATAYVTAGDTTGSGGEEYSNSILAQTKVKSLVPLFTSQAVSERVISALGLTDTPAELSSRITARRVEDTVTLQISARAGSPEQAQAIADEVVVAAFAELKRLEPNTTTKITKVSSARLSSTPVSPSKKRYFGGGFVIGLAAGYLIALIRSRYDTKIRTSEDLEGRISQPVIGVLPQSAGVQSLEFGLVDDFRAREALRKLRTNLRYANVDKKLETVVVTSPTMGDGKSSVAAFLASVLADAGNEVLLVDTDLRRPTVAEKMKADGSIGITQVLAGIVPIGDAIQKTEIQGLSILPAGEIPANPSEVLGSRRMKELVAYLSKKYFVILDAPPLLPVTDAALLSRISDGALIVLSANKTTYVEARSAVRTVESVDGKVIGVVLNRASTKRFSRMAYGDAEYGYGPGVSSYSKYSKYESTYVSAEQSTLKNVKLDENEDVVDEFERPTASELPPEAPKTSIIQPASTNASSTSERQHPFLSRNEWLKSRKSSED